MKINKLPRSFIAVLLLSLVSLPAFAANVTLTAAQIQSFTQVGSSGGGTPFTFNTNIDGLGASFTTLWGSSDFGVQTALVGLSGLGLDWSAFDTFSMTIANNNENGWDFNVFVFDGTTTNSATLLTLPADNSFTTFVVDLTGLTKTTIADVYLSVSADLPIGGSDRNAEYTVHAVPVPASVWLFSSALGLLVWIRRKAA